MNDRDHIGLAREYEDDVLAGRIPVCKWVRLACERNRRDLARQGTAAFPYVFDEIQGRRICLAAEMFPHIKGPKAQVVGRDEENRPIYATIQLEPWQCWFLSTLFGWMQADGRLRRFRVALMLVPRKNAKSTLAACVVLFMLVLEGEMGAECYSAATTRDQAKVVAEIAWEMARRSPAFCDIQDRRVRIGAKTTSTLTVPAFASKFAPLSADANTLDALNVSLAVIDELHAHKTRAVWDVLDTATGAREQPLILSTTTAGVDLGGICYEKLGYLHKVLEGSLADEQFFGVEYTIDEGDDWKLPASWQKANPNYGVSVNPEDLERKAREAEHSPAAVNNFLTKHLNVWVRAESAFHPMKEWIALGDPSLKIEDFAKAPCWIGVDLAEIRDVAAVVAVFRPDKDTYAIFGRYYLPENAVTHSPIAQMSGWARDGYLLETEGDQADFQRIEDDIIAWCDQLNIREIDFDRALSAHMSQRLKERLRPRMGRDAVDAFVVTVPQNVETMNPAMQGIVGLTLAGKIRHDGNPVLTWMFSNVVVELNHKGEVYPRKAGGKNSPHKIDGPVAIYTAFSRAAAAEIKTKKTTPFFVV